MGDLIAYVFMCMISWMIRLPCEITDQLAVGTQNCFSTLFYTPYILTLKQTPRMHQNAQLPDKKFKKNLGRGHGPLPRPFPHWGGDTPSPDHTSILLGVPVPFHLRLNTAAMAPIRLLHSTYVQR